MGCGCKQKEMSPNLLKENSDKLNYKGVILKSLTIIGLTVLIIVISPLLLGLMWYIMFKSVMGDEVNLVNFLLKFSKKEDNNDMVYDDDDVYTYDDTIKDSNINYVTLNE